MPFNRKTIGNIGLVVGLTLTIFTLSNKASGIPIRELWFVLGSLLTIGGLIVIILEQKIRKADKDRQRQKKPTITDILKNGIVFNLSRNDFEIKSHVSYPDIPEPLPSRRQMLDSLTSSVDRNVSPPVESCYLICSRRIGEKECRFVSQLIPMPIDILEQTIKTFGMIKLYILPADPKSYYFDLPFIR